MVVIKVLLLDRNEKLIGSVQEMTEFDPVHSFNGEDILEFATTTSTAIEKGYRILYQNKNKVWHEYIVKGVDETKLGNKIEKQVFCENSFYETLGDFIEDSRPSGRADVALEKALENSRWDVGLVEVETNSSTMFYRTSAKEAVNQVVEIWGGELVTRVEVTNNKVARRSVDLLKRRGTRHKKRLTYSTGLQSAERIIHRDDIVTALYGFGAGEEIDDGFGRRINFSSINNGKMYLENNEAKELWGRLDEFGNKEHVFDKVEFLEIEDIEELKEATQKELDRLSEIKISYIINANLLKEDKDISLGDTIVVVDKDFTPDLRVEARVIEVRPRPLEEDSYTITLGNFEDDIINEFENRDEYIDNTVEHIYSNIGKVQQHANGKNRIFRGVTEPVTGVIEGDLWYRPLGNGQYEMYIHDGESWGDPIILTGINQEIEDALKEAEQNIEDARDEVDRVQSDADSILVGLGVKDLPNTHYEIVSGIQENIVGKINGFNTDLEAVEGSLNARLDDIMDNIDGIEGDFSNFADKIYVTNKVDNAKGEITNIITGIKNNPEGTILGYNTMKSTVSGNVSEIGRIKQSPSSTITGYNRLTETTDMVERVIGSRNESDSLIKDRMARMIMAENIFQTEISDTIDTSIDGVLGATNFFDKEQASLGAIDGNGNVIGTGTNEMYSNFIPVEPSKTYRLKYTTSSAGIFSFVRVVYYNSRYQFMGQLHYSTQDKAIDSTYEIPSNARYVRMSASFLGNNQATLEFTTGGLLGDIETIKTRVTQLSDSWALRIESNDELVTAINASTEGVYVKGEYITLDGDTNVAGDFTVTGSMLARDATIQNLKGQTLNFAEINAIFFNAESISTGTLRGIRVEADSGLIGGWNLESGGLYKETPYGYTTLKPGGSVAIGIASPNYGHTTGAALQIWHDGTLRFGESANRIYGDKNANLVFEAHNWIYLKPRATVFVEGRIAPWSNNTGSVGASDYRWWRMYSESYRVGNSRGGIQGGSGSDDGANSIEVFSSGSLLLKSINRDIYSQGSLYPYYPSNTYYLGSSGYRWQGIFIASGGYDEGSDARYKDNIRDIPNELIKAFSKYVKPRMYDIEGKVHAGYIAQDVERALFKHVTESKMFDSVQKAREYVDSFKLLNRGESYKSLVYNQVQTIKIQEVEDKSKELEEKLNKAEIKNRKLEERLNKMEEILNG